MIARVDRAVGRNKNSAKIEALMVEARARAKRERESSLAGLNAAERAAVLRAQQEAQFDIPANLLRAADEGHIAPPLLYFNGLPIYRRKNQRC